MICRSETKNRVHRKQPKFGGLNRAAIMRDAHKRYRDGKRLGLGWKFDRCLRLAWTAAKLRREFPRRQYQPAGWTGQEMRA